MMTAEQAWVEWTSKKQYLGWDKLDKQMFIAGYEAGVQEHALQMISDIGQEQDAGFKATMQSDTVSQENPGEN